MNDRVAASTSGEWEGRPASHWADAWNIPVLSMVTATTSTNDVAATLAEQDAPAGATVIAEQQTAGRGRRGRSWTAAPGHSILMSTLMRAAQPGADPSAMPVRVGLAVIRAIARATGIDARIKWPNDIVLPQAGKLGGILCEGATGTTGSWLVAGIGLNVSQSVDDFPPALRQDAASIRTAGGSADRATLVAAILDELRPFVIVPPPLEPDVYDELRDVDALRGRRVSVDGEWAGTAIGIATDATLSIRTSTGTRSVRSGTIRIEREARTREDHDTAPGALEPRRP